MKIDLKQLQKVEVEILDKIDEICKENSIEYFLIGGSCLGAVRHKGFIPWDDDIDIGMMREDYDKFIKLCMDGALGEKYYLHCNETDKDFYLPFAKVRKNNTTFAEEALSNVNTHKGIYVDIFPYDNVKKQDSLKQKIQAFLYKTMTETIFVKYKVRKIKECRKPWLIVLFRILPSSIIKKMQLKLALWGSRTNYEYMVVLSGAYSYKNDTVRKRKVFPLKMIDFEGKKYPTFKDCDYYLSKIYGDYMTLPPVEKRVTHKPLEISFDKGENRINKN